METTGRGKNGGCKIGGEKIGGIRSPQILPPKKIYPRNSKGHFPYNNTTKLQQNALKKGQKKFGALRAPRAPKFYLPPN